MIIQTFRKVICVNFKFLSFAKQRPAARATIEGSNAYKSVSGTVRFYEAREGVVVMAQIEGLPESAQACSNPIFGMHIHSGGSCTGDDQDPFADAMTHYNPDNCPHPYHRGDLPPLFGCDGMAVCVFLTDRFSIDEIVGKTVIIHSNADDFTSQPSGNAGDKIACGVIEKVL